MTWEKFWSIIDRVRAQADMQDEASVNQFLYTELIKLPQDELLGFDCVCLAFEATLTDRQIDMLQELGYLPVITRQYGEECANCPYTLDEREHGICRRCAVFKK